MPGWMPGRGSGSLQSRDEGCIAWISAISGNFRKREPFPFPPVSSSRGLLPASSSNLPAGPSEAPVLSAGASSFPSPRVLTRPGRGDREVAPLDELRCSRFLPDRIFATSIRDVAMPSHRAFERCAFAPKRAVRHSVRDSRTFLRCEISSIHRSRSHVITRH